MEKYDDNFYRELFKFYDQENTGSITVDRFIEISKNSMPETWNNDERLDEIKKALDPNEVGKIDYLQFVEAIKKLTAEDNNNNDLIDYDTEVFNETNLDIKKSDSSILDSSGFIDYVDRKSTNSPNSFSNDTFDYGSESSKNKNNTFNSLDQGISEKSDKDEKLFDDLLSMEFIESRELKRNDSGSDKENKDLINDDDPFGFGVESMNNHRKSLINSTMSNSFLDIKGLNRRGSEYFNNKSSFDQDSNMTDSKVYLEYDILNSNKNYDDLKEDQLIEKYEDKINVLSFQNENLTNEKNELLNIVNKLNSEKSDLIEKIRDVEEINLEQEKKINQLTQDQFRLVEQLNKANTALHEENESHLIMKSNLEKTLATYKEENSRYIKIMSDINRKIELSDQKLNEEIEKYNELKTNFLKILKEKEIIKEESIIENSKNIEKIASLTKELNDSRLFLQQQVQKQRSDTVFDQSSSSRYKEMENEMNKARLEIQRLNEHIDELNAQYIKTNIDNGRMLVNFSQQNSPSFAAEMNTMSKDDLMEKLKTEQQISKRLREYVDEIISKILEYNPEILEINPGRQANKTTSTNKQQKGQQAASAQLSLSYKNLKAKAK